MFKSRTRRFLSDRRGDLATRVAGGAAVITVFSVGAAHYLSERVEAEKRVLAAIAGGNQQKKERLVTVRPGDFDNVTTGSIRNIANDTRFDPCVDQKKR